jgi:hypothetical protein
MTNAALALVVAAAVAASLAAPALAQTPSPAVPSGSASRLGVNGQLDDLNRRIDRASALGRISQDQAVEDHRQVNSLQDEASADREQHGGKLIDAERFELQAKIDRLRQAVQQQRSENPSAPSH